MTPFSATSLYKPIFLVGCPRSGTTLLQRMLNAHPELAIAPETHFMRRFWQQRLRYGPLNDDNNFRRLIQDITRMPEFEEMGLSPGLFEQEARMGERTYASLFGLLLLQFARQQGVWIVGEKTPDHLLHMQTLQQFFPTARFIHIVRDPRAVVNSLRNVPWSKGTLTKDAEVWRRNLALVRRQCPQLGAALHTIHYEQLVADPEEVLQPLCRFLGIPYAPCMLAYHEAPTYMVNLEREPWKRNVARPLSTDALDRWRKDLSPSMIADIEAVVLPEMQRWNYEVDTPHLFLPHLLHMAKIVAIRLRNRITHLRKQLLLKAKKPSFLLARQRSFLQNLAAL